MGLIKFWTALALALCIIVANPSKGFAESSITVRDMLYYCNAEKGTRTEGFCIGYMAGITRAILQSEPKPGSFNAKIKDCVVSNRPSPGQCQAMYVKVAKENPDIWQETAYFGWLLVLDWELNCSLTAK
jgi:hypothetical protein